jgi:hypothetical protein
MTYSIFFFLYFCSYLAGIGIYSVTAYRVVVAVDCSRLPAADCGVCGRPEAQGSEGKDPYSLAAAHVGVRFFGSRGLRHHWSCDSRERNQWQQR